MTECHREKTRAARQRVVDELARFRGDNSEDRLATLNAAIENWHATVGAWNEALSAERVQKLT
jgi:hypothetical protein